MKTTIFGLILLLLASTAYATTYYVSSRSGSDWYTCYMASNKYFAKKTIASAKQCARPGDTIVVLN